MNWQHFRTFVWLRWRLFLNQLRRGGTTNAIIQMILAIGVLILAVVMSVSFFLIGLSAVDADLQRNIQLLKQRPWFDKHGAVWVHWERPIWLLPTSFKSCATGPCAKFFACRVGRTSL